LGRRGKTGTKLQKRISYQLEHSNFLRPHPIKTLVFNEEPKERIDVAVLRIGKGITPACWSLRCVADSDDEIFRNVPCTARGGVSLVTSDLKKRNTLEYRAQEGGKGERRYTVPPNT